MDKLLVIVCIVGTLGLLCQGRSTFYHPEDNTDEYRFEQPDGANPEYYGYYSSGDVDVNARNGHFPVAGGVRRFHQAENLDRPTYPIFAPAISPLSYNSPYFAGLNRRFRPSSQVDPYVALQAKVTGELHKLYHLLCLQRKLKADASLGYDNLFVSVATRILKSAQNPPSNSAISRAQYQLLRNALLAFLFPNTKLSQDLSVSNLSTPGAPVSNGPNTTATATDENVTTPAPTATTAATQTQSESIDGVSTSTSTQTQQDQVYSERASSHNSNVGSTSVAPDGVAEAATDNSTNSGQAGNADISQITSNVLPFLG